MEEGQFRKLVESLQPQSQYTRKLCQKLGYNPDDFKFRPSSDFTGVMQKTKYEHYQLRILKIINDIIIHKTKGRHHGQILYNARQSYNQLLPMQSIEIGSQSSNESQDASEVQEIKTGRDRVLQKLAFNELNKRKRNIESISNYTQKLNHIHQSSTQHKTNKKPNKRAQTEQKRNQDDYFKREEYLENALKTQSKVAEIKTSHLQMRVKPINNNKLHRMRLEQSMSEEHFSQQTLQDILQKEREAQRRMEQQKQEIINQLTERNKQYAEKLKKREIKEIEFEMDQIQKQCVKYENQIKNKEELERLETKIKKDKLNQTQAHLKKWHQRLDHLQLKQEERSSSILDQLNSKTEKVINSKKDYLNTRSLQLQEMQRIREEDISFNRTHNELKKLQNDSKTLEKSKLIIDRKHHQQNLQEVQRMRSIKNVFKDRRNENKLWYQVTEATRLFEDPYEYENYRNDLKLVMLKQKQSLSPKYSQLTNIIQKLLPPDEAKQILIPDHLQEEVEEELKKQQKQQ